MVRDDAAHQIIEILGVCRGAVNRHRLPLLRHACAPMQDQRRARSAHPSAPRDRRLFLAFCSFLVALRHDSRKKFRPWSAVSVSPESAISIVVPWAATGGAAAFRP